MALYDPRKTTRAERTVLRRLFPDVDLSDYDRNRNDYEGYNVGRDTLDKAIDSKAWELSRALEAADKQHDREAHRHIASCYRREHDVKAARDGYEALAETLTDLARQARDMAAVLDMRAEDDRADEALDTFGATIRAARA